MKSKAELRTMLRKKRRDHAKTLPDSVRALMLNRPPAILLERISDDAIIGLYRATSSEAPAHGYARFFHERSHTLTLPRFAHTQATMEFAQHTDPFDESDCEPGPYAIVQPQADAPTLVPDVLLIPLIGFTPDGKRLGQGGGHYDRWLAEHPDTFTIGLAWDCQCVDTLPIEEHDQGLSAVITPTRLYGPF